jgi:hypothetical protein
MNTEQLEAELYACAKRGAESIIRDGTPLQACILTLSDEGLEAVPLLMHDRGAARATLALAASNLRFFCTVNEAWLATVKDPEHFDITKEAAPSTRTDREEAVVVTLFSNGAPVITGMMKFKRNPDAPVNAVTCEPWVETGPGIEFKATPESGSIFPG